MWLASRRRWISDTSDRRSSASSLVMGQCIRGAWAVVLRNMPNVPRTRLAKPRCSLCFALGLERIDGNHRRHTTKSSINQGGAIVNEARFGAQLVSHALNSLQDCMEVVVSQQFFAAELKDVRMNPSTCKIGPQFPGATSRIAKCPRRICLLQFSGFGENQPSKQERLVESRAEWLESLGRAHEPLWFHRVSNKGKNSRPIAAGVLVGGKRIEDAMPFGHIGVGIWDSARCENIFDFAAGEPLLRVAERIRNRGQLCRGE